VKPYPTFNFLFNFFFYKKKCCRSTTHMNRCALHYLLYVLFKFSILCYYNNACFCQLQLSNVRHLYISDYTERKRCHTEPKRVSYMKRNFKIVSYMVQNLKKPSIFETNSKPFLGFMGNLRNL